MQITEKLISCTNCEICVNSVWSTWFVLITFAMEFNFTNLKTAKDLRLQNHKKNLKFDYYAKKEVDG